MNAALLGRRSSPQLLISVCTLDEAKIALAQGADIIDLKNPHAGALGALPLALSIRQQTDSGRPTVVADPDGVEAQLYKQIARKLAVKVAEKAKDMSSKFPSIVIKND